MTPREPPITQKSYHGNSIAGSSRVHMGDHHENNIYTAGAQREQSFFQSLTESQKADRLFKAATEGQYRRLYLLIHADADLDCKTEEGHTALHLASRHADEKCIRLLIDNGADINAINSHGRQPIHEAVEFNNKEAIEVLLERGASKDALTKSTELARPEAMVSQGERFVHSGSVTSLQEGFKHVLLDFKKALKPEDVTRFEVATLADLQRAIRDIQEHQRKTKTAQNLKRIESFLRAMTQFKDTIEEFLDASPILCFVWGPVNFMLSTASNWNKAFEVILGAYKEIGENFPLLSKHRQLFRENDHMKKVLVWIYEDILKFHRRALGLFSQPAWKQLFSATWKDSQESFKPIMSDLLRHRELIESTASLEQIQEIREVRMRSQASFASLEVEQSRTKTLAVINWLSAADSQVDYDNFITTSHEIPGSSCWILQEERVKEWLEPQESTEPILWLNGKPGAGKTILASIIIEECLKRSKSTEDLSLAFFYCRDQDSQRNRFVAVAKSILVQLLAHNPSLLPYLYEECLKSTKVTLQSSQDCIRLLKTALEVAVQTILIIDGIDECEPKERKAIMNFFTSVITENPDGKVRGLFVSQELSDIKTALQMAEVIKLTKEHSEMDIKNFAIEHAAKIQNRFSPMPDIAREHIVRMVCDGAEGMFLFAKLVLENLYDQGNLEDVYKELHPDSFPHGFDQAYARIVNRIFKNPNLVQRQIAKSLVGWIAFSKRPLKWHEIQGAACIDVEQQAINFEFRKIPDHVRDICGSLVEVMPGDRVQLVHSTARSYLIQGKCLDSKQEEARLTILCMRYLTFPCFEMDICAEDILRYAKDGSYSFLEYASLHWFHHLDSLLPFLEVNDLSNSTELGMAVNDFFEMYNPVPEHYGDGIDDTSHKNEKFYKEYTECSKKIQAAECCESMVLLLSHAKERRIAEEKIEALEGLGDTINKIRACLAELMSRPTARSEIARLTQFYGEKWYKCSRHACYYFHEGFSKEGSLAQHINRHEKPFCCTEMGCTRMYIGWSTEKELKKHMSQYHPDPETFSWKFPHIKKPPARFSCDVCANTYSRASILKTHKLKHTNERPYVCTVCQKSFTRQYDLGRHSKIHEKPTPAGS